MDNTNQLERLITICVETKAKTSYDSLTQLLPGTELYCNMGIDSHGRQTIPSHSLGRVRRALMFYISKADPKLMPPFGGMPWKDILIMVARIPDAEGVAIMNSREDWVFFSRVQLSTLA